MQISLSPPVRFLPFKEFHLAPIGDLTPDAIKHSAQQAHDKYRDRESIKLVTCQNFIAKALGCKGGFASYSQEYTSKLLPFMAKNGLKTRTDLCTSRTPSPHVITLTPRCIADRIFCSGKPLPSRIFTSYDYDWYNVIRHRSDDFRRLSFDEVYTEWSASRSMKFLESVVDRLIVNGIFNWGNLLGGQLLCYQQSNAFIDKPVSTIYYQNDFNEAERLKELEQHAESLKIFQLFLENLDTGWVDVIRYNDKLIFLKGANGEYDIVFSGLRNTPFKHNIYAPFLKNADVPKSHDSYHFLRWLYFEYNGWLKSDQHKAEEAFYAGGGTSINYPGTDEIYRSFFLKTSQYTELKESAGPRPGYYSTCVNGQTLHVSNLISILDFKRFLQANPAYGEYSRKGGCSDRFEPVNADGNETLPASVTWYDANAYAAWISKTQHIPVRLLTEYEYDTIARPTLNPPPLNSLRQEWRESEKIISTDTFGQDIIVNEQLCTFFAPDGTPISGHPPFMSEENFQSLEFRYIRSALKWKSHPDGFNFLSSLYFQEWLDKEGAAVNCRTLSSWHEPTVSPYRCTFSPSSTGKYKSLKIGFRLCYLGYSQ